MIPFFITASVLVLVLPLVVRYGVAHSWIAEIPSFLYETTWIVAIFTSIIFVYLYRSGKAGFFVQLYLLSMALKLLAYFAYNLIIILEDRENAVANVVYFLLVYILYTVIEIAFLYRKISPSSRS